ncbi:MAG: hypothetical protein ABJO27_09385 [Pseudoruegeria sp.]
MNSFWKLPSVRPRSIPILGVLPAVGLVPTAILFRFAVLGHNPNRASAANGGYAGCNRGILIYPQVAGLGRPFRRSTANMPDMLRAI